MSHLIDKYNRPTPRYTSYPPANFFSADFREKDLLSAIEASNSSEPRHVSFYVHVPFCPKLCYYCGCNAYAMQGSLAVEQYMDAVIREIEMILPLIDSSRGLAQIHYGGGTPTAIPLHYLWRINDLLRSRFKLIDEAEIAIECHPGFLNKNGWEELVSAGFTRMSIGVQDFHDDVLHGVSRQPSRLPLEEIVPMLHSHSVKVNMDFIYGLPMQTRESFAENMQRALAIRPDRLVTFSYAHVPHIKEKQQLLEAAGLPSPDEKADMYAEAVKILTAGGYRTVGMDHFVQPDDALWRAADAGMLHRNFQGYCTRATTGQVYAFGVTAITQLTSAYAQNVRDIEQYIRLVDSGHLPVMRGYAMQGDEQIAGHVITTLMCNDRVVWADAATTLGIDKGELLSTLSPNKQLLHEMQSDGLIELTSEGIRITPEGHPFVRIAASALDPLMLRTGGRTFSNAI